MSRTRALLTDGVIYTVGDMLTIGVSGFLLIPVYVRFMSAAEYGVYGAVSAAVAVTSAVAQLGLLSSLARYYYAHRDAGRQAEYLGALVGFQTGIALLLALLAWLLGERGWRWVFPTVPYAGFAAVVLLAAVTAFGSNLYPIWLRVHNRARAFVVVQLMNMLVLCLCVAWFVVARRGGALGALLSSAASNVVMCVVSLVALQGQAKLTPRLSLLRGSVSFGLWTMAGTVGYLLLNRSQLFVLQHRLPMGEVGHFFLASQLAGVLAIVSTSFSKALQPSLYATRTTAEASDVLNRFTRPYIVVLLYAAVTLIVFAGDVLALLAGSVDPSTTAALRVLTVACLCYAASALPSSALLYTRRVVVVEVILIAALVVNVVCGAKLAVPFGIVGAAWAVVLGFAALLLGNYWYAQRVMPVRYELGVALRGAVCGAVAVGVALWLPKDGVFGVAARLGVMILFTALLFAAGVVRRQDVGALAAMTAGPRRRLGLGY